ncbi:hypothetical protein CBS76997_9380 [Aspergillus niger]|nr:hypothetical protein CBS13152_5017 [Aspergillus niger]KAI2970281.1 hypothetical protein CBS147323_3405 [Aspergillus niger]KAI3032137.1 hypothetical protein CBS147347_1798 [Aspergillus niger]KAI3037098.1 hypothetical protein CBS76997_9380 [Aspergillus niger]KAI3087185.1 hypothetical protein CBS147353_937 [Aspergillus niger]
MLSTPSDNEEGPTSSSLDIHYGECYYIKDNNGGKSLGSDGGVYSYYKFGPRWRQVFLWANGGSWVATSLGGHTYPGFDGYWYYLHFRGNRAHKRMHGGIAVTLEIAQVELPSPLSSFRGLEVSWDYIWNQDNEDTIDVIFVSTDCHDDDNDAVDV